MVGNSGLGGSNFLGTTDSVALELHVYNNDATASRGSKRVMRFEPNATSANIIGGFQGNKVLTGKVGSVITGGGAYTDTNQTRSNYTVIDGGMKNFIDTNSDYSIIAGGNNNGINDSCHNTFMAGDSNGVSGGTTNTALIGNSLTAQSYGQTILGHYNIAEGSSTSAIVNDTDDIFTIGNGTSGNRSDAFQVYNNGTSVVHSTNGSTKSPVMGGDL